MRGLSPASTDGTIKLMSNVDVFADASLQLPYRAPKHLA